MVGPAKPAHYLDIYRRLFERYEVGSVLELGVHQGGSLRFFAELAPTATITGIDHDLGMVEYPLPDNVSVVQGDCTDATLLGYYDVDVVVDDASHRWADQQASWAALWPRTALCYVIEDLDVCYRPNSQWSVGRNTMDWLNQEVEELHRGNGRFSAITFHPGLVVLER